MLVRHVFYTLAGLTTLALITPHALDWMAGGGNILNPVTFFGDAIHSGGSAAFLAIDMALMWALFMVWVVTDARHIGLGTKVGALFVVLSFVAMPLAAPAYLIIRERRLADPRG